MNTDKAQEGGMRRVIRVDSREIGEAVAQWLVRSGVLPNMVTVSVGLRAQGTAVAGQAVSDGEIWAEVEVVEQPPIPAERGW